jgi:NTP pyrophosphatase (non-canonical NTP hydrolase)
VSAQERGAEPISFAEYQVRAASTAWYPHKMESAHPTAMAYCVLKLNGEAGEAAEVLGKTWRNEGEALRLSTREQLLLLDELGDVQWYVAQIANELSVRLSDIARWNLFKLAKRAELGKAGWDEDKKEELLQEFWSALNDVLTKGS